MAEEFTPLSMAGWFMVSVIILYLGRIPAHRAILSFTRGLHSGLRLASGSVLRGVDMLKKRNREVLLALGADASERSIEREFQRIENVIKRDLDSYPTLHRNLHERVQKIDEDYHNSIEQPPEPPGWTNAVNAVAQIPHKGDPMVAEILEEMNKSLSKAQENALDEYRKDSRDRHLILKNMMPHWRKTSEVLEEVGKSVKDIIARSKDIDNQIKEYKQIKNAEASAERTLHSSSLTQFFISGTVLFISIFGAMINFHLIAYPMQEMVGGSGYLGSIPLKISEIAALVIITVEITLGLFLMETLRITKLFPIIGALDDKVRKRLVWIFFFFIFFLASVEASLAYMRDLLIANKEAAVQSITGSALVEPLHRWIPTVGGMALGFILPFALVFVAIPVESFVHSSRTVIGMLAVGLLRLFAYLLRLLGNGFQYLGITAIHLYDVIVFGPLWVERVIREKRGSSDSVKHSGATRKANIRSAN